MQLCTDPIPKSLDFLSGLAVGLQLLGCLAVPAGIPMHLEAVQDRRNHRKFEFREDRASDFFFAPAVGLRHGEHGGGGLAGRSCQAFGARELFVGFYVRRTGYEHEVGIFDGGGRFCAARGRCVDDNEIAARLGGLFEHLRKLDFGDEADKGELVPAPVRPLCRGLLGVHVEREDVHPVF
mgnify:CR=1 FL=1